MSLGPPDTITPKDESDTQGKQRLSRSPHPYHHRSLDAVDRVYLNRLGRPDPLQLSKDRFPRPGLPNIQREPSSRFFRISNRTASPSDSGTEADDERPLLKALTAPPLRPRKGLKGAKGSPVDSLASPLPTPFSLEEDDKRGILGGHAVQERKGGKAPVKEHSKKLRCRQHHYGRVELLRRVLETVLLGFVGYLCLYNKGSDAIQALSWHTFLVLLVYSTYVVRLLLRIMTFSDGGPFRAKFRLPATVDPAPLLYPVFLPLLVTWSVEPVDAMALLSNCILSFSTLPRKAIPLMDFHVHWIITLLPLLNSDVATRYRLPRDLVSHRNTYSINFTEEQTLLFPLHCALVQTLGFLTTTSLLPAELQLLSVSLINLLCFGQTYQSLILKGLLWIGGVALVASCRHALQWSVELARVPSWRFRRRKHRKGTRVTLVCAIHDTFGGWLSRVLKPRYGDDSSDEEWTPKFSPQTALPKGLRHLDAEKSTQTTIRRTFQNALASVDDFDFDDNSALRTSEVVSATGVYGTRSRRHTLPSSLSPIPDIPALTKTATDALSSARFRSKLLIRLTAAQAAVLKWLYAAFVYLAAIAIILIPVRLFIGYSALNGNEPFGWALGYLFGNLDAFRFRVVYLNLEHWIVLPERYAAWEQYPGLGEYIRHGVLGPANTRLLLCGWYVVNIAAGLTIVFRLRNVVEVDTRRKVFHGMMVSMFLPTVFIDPTFIALAFALVLTIFLLLDLFRASQLPPLSRPLTHFLAPYVDGRDHRGPIIISHIFLLIGCAIPLWLSLADTKRTGLGPSRGWDVETRDISMVTGIICVGMGDAAASLIGRRFGHRRWPWSGGKSLEGSAAFAIAVVVGLVASRMLLLAGEWKGDGGDAWLTTLTKSTIAACGASLTEAVLTGGNDNVVVPVILWLLVRGLKV